MANAGYSSDCKLCHAVTNGLWNGKYGNSAKYIIIELPKHKDNDDIHQTALKNLVYEYYNTYYQDLEHTSNNWKNTKIRRLNKLIYRLNQYRQKHWYWKTII